ncbi:MAG: methionine--tRNA ligase [Actinomycetia bacterium]|nr:methionine--tRNA ligase [Actinomycetes bacterium]
MPQKSFYVTTPIYYVNDAPHIGHAYTSVAGDVITRWHRQHGESVIYLTGTDEHGTKVASKAEANDMAPQDWVDKLVAEHWKPVLETLNVANDDFIRTTQKRHRRGVQKFWEVLKEQGFVYQADYNGPYCVACEEFKLPGDLLEGEGDELICKVHGKPVQLLNEKNWFFKLQGFQEQLIEHYERHPTAIAPASAYNEVLSFIRSGLSDVSMSRESVDWGVRLPWDPEQVVYVWFDALLNYITAIGYGDSQAEDAFADIWPADIHLVGKDILRFHAVFWPAMLMAAGLPLPKQVFAHGWLLVGGEKMSKTKLTGIAPNQISDHFGVDAFRYYFMAAINFGADGSFSWEDMHDRYHADLANGLGNLASRSLAMVTKYFDGRVPQPGSYTNADLALQDELVEAVANADAAMLRLDFSTGIARVRGYVESVNGYITEQEPWKLAKDESKQTRLATVLYCVMESLRAIAVLYAAVMPEACERLWADIGASGKLSDQTIEQVDRWGQLEPGASVSKGPALFPRIDKVT